MKLTRSSSAAALLAVLVSPAAAHFPWLATDDDGRALLFFSESLAERNYHLPDAVRLAKVYGGENAATAELKLEEVDEASLLARRTSEPVAEDVGLHTQVAYGVYHGTYLVYYAQHDAAVGEEARERTAEQLALRAHLATTDGGSLRATLHWQAEPLAGVEVELLNDQGEQVATGNSDAAGVVTFGEDALPGGLAALRVGHSLADDAGEDNGKAYTSSTHYLTATFRIKDTGIDARTVSDLPTLPNPIASFGAAVSDGWLYVYGGHTGTAHTHSVENLSNHFSRIRLDEPTDWQSLPMGQPLQGLPLVAHGGKLYRVGGMHARNQPDADEDMHSSNTFARFDPATGEWRQLAPLPERRSSHDAVVIGDRLYVVGGWTLTGSSDGEWLDTAWSCDLLRETPAWEEITKPPFRRRAIAASHLDGRLLVLGGMDEDVKVSGAVFAFDPDTGEWSSLAKLPGKGISGFGVSAWNDSGVVYASGMQGVVYQLQSPAGEWQKLTTMKTPRFFHRLLPAEAGKLVAVAGASPEFGHVATSEIIPLAD